MHKQTVVKATSPEQFLASLPMLLGYFPRESLVIVPLRRNRSVGALRIDLPSSDTNTQTLKNGSVSSLVNWVIATLCRLPEVDALAAVIFSDKPLDPHDRHLPQLGLITLLGTASEAGGFQLLEALMVNGENWYSYFDPAKTTHSAPWPRRSSDFDQLAGAELPLISDTELKELRRCQLLFGQIIRLNLPATAPSLTSASDLSEAELLSGLNAEKICELIKQFDFLKSQNLEPDELADRLLNPEFDYSPAWTIYLQFCLRQDTFRNGLLHYYLTEPNPEAFLGSLPGFEDLLTGKIDSLDTARLTQLLETFRKLTARAVTELDLAPLLATCGWLSWALGQASHAGHYAEQALEIEHSNQLALKTIELVKNAQLPAWLFREIAAEIKQSENTVT